MKVEIAEKLLRALISGKYGAAKNQLRTNMGYCCLGVLCDLYHAETGKGQWRGRTVDKAWWVFEVGSSSDGNYLPPAVQEWAGVVHKNPMGLGATNDEDGWPAVIQFLRGYIAAKRDDNI